MMGEKSEKEEMVYQKYMKDTMETSTTIRSERDE